ncbi:MAG: hypothetical protein LUD82_08640 [Clostridiales bacterium]|nr:hypothetical protein [Clostridiales bacterium]
MKATVLKKFKDKNTGKVYKPGDTVTLTEARFKEILKVGPLVERVKQEAADTAEEAGD